jgi:hypothetical protein
MKKMIIVLTALLLAAPALADVTFSCSDAGSGKLQIGFTATEDTNLPRGIGLVVTLSNAAEVNGVVSADPNYWVYPGSIDINDSGVIEDEGTPLAVGADTNEAILEMGSLHWPTGPSDANSPPLVVSNLITLQLVANGETTTNVTLSGDAERGGVVNYAAGSADVSFGAGCTVTFDCYTGPDYAAWVAVGKPASWCNPRQCHGDADGVMESDKSLPYDFWVGVADLQIMAAYWQGPNGDKPEPPADCLTSSPVSP